MNRDKSIRGVCVICKEENVTSYHYGKAHGLVPRELFSYRSETKLWECRKHRLSSLDPHYIMMHFWREHMHSHPSKLPYKTREPNNPMSTFYGNVSGYRGFTEKEEEPVSINTSGVVANISDYPPITAEAIVKAFEDRVKTIDKALEAKESTIIAISNALGKKRAELDEQQIHIEAAHKEIDKLRDELSRANEQFDEVEDKTNSLIARLFKR